MVYIQHFVHVLQIIVFIYLALAVLYLFFFSLASLFHKKCSHREAKTMRKIAVLIPGYKEDDVIVDVAEDALKQDYPPDRYEVIVIADSFKESTLESLRALPLRVVEVAFEVSSKARALNKCMDVIGDDYDIAMILDADNLMDKDVLKTINKCFDSGVVAIQGHRTAKNMNTDLAVLDAASEEINNSIFRKGHRAAGLSAALIGSGMAFDYALYKSYMAQIDSVGEDKELEMMFLKAKYTIEYEDCALIYDEKTSRSDNFVNQRRRWLAAQVSYFRKNFLDGCYHLLRYGNVDYFDKVFQMIQPPRVLLAGLLFLLSLSIAFLALWKNPTSDEWIIIWHQYWIALLVITLLALVIAVPKKFFNLKTAKAILALPRVFLLMVISLLRMKGAGKKFIHTTHGHTQ